jgi:hypothetical protein
MWGPATKNLTFAPEIAIMRDRFGRDRRDGFYQGHCARTGEKRPIFSRLSRNDLEGSIRAARRKPSFAPEIAINERGAGDGPVAASWRVSGSAGQVAGG